MRRKMYWGEASNAIETDGKMEESKKIYFDKLRATLNISNEEIKLNSKASAEAADAARAKVDSAIAKAIESTPSLSSFSNAKIRACVFGRSNPHLYEGRPKVSMMLQFFKRPWAVQSHIDRVMECQKHYPIELLVNVDHPSDHEAWAWASYNTSGVVVPVFSSNIHEIRSYNRLAHLARGDIVVMLQDDDLLPTGNKCSWIGELMSIFERWPDTGLVGLRGYQLCFDGTDGVNEGAYFQDSVTGLKAHWVQRVDMAPMAIRRIAYLGIGGMDETLSDPGYCGIISDWEICQRMWTGGWAVMHFGSRLEKSGDGQTGGTHRPENAYKCWGAQQGTAGSVMSTRTFGREWELEMCEAARRMNLQNLKLISESRCPYAKYKIPGCVWAENQTLPADTG